MNLYSLYKWFVYIPGLALVTGGNVLCCALVAVFSPGLASRWIATAWARALLRMVPAQLTVSGEQYLDSSQSYIRSGQSPESI